MEPIMFVFPLTIMNELFDNPCCWVSNPVEVCDPRFYQFSILHMENIPTHTHTRTHRPTSMYKTLVYSEISHGPSTVEPASIHQQYFIPLVNIRAPWFFCHRAASNSCQWWKNLSNKITQEEHIHQSWKYLWIQNGLWRHARIFVVCLLLTSKAAFYPGFVRGALRQGVIFCHAVAWKVFVQYSCP